MAWIPQIWSRLNGLFRRPDDDFSSLRIALERAAARERRDEAARAAGVAPSDRQGR